MRLLLLHCLQKLFNFHCHLMTSATFIAITLSFLLVILLRLVFWHIGKVVRLSGIPTKGFLPIWATLGTPEAYRAQALVELPLIWSVLMWSGKCDMMRFRATHRLPLLPKEVTQHLHFFHKICGHDPLQFCLLTLSPSISRPHRHQA